MTVIDAESNYISFLAPGDTIFSGSISLSSPLPTASTVTGPVTSGNFVPYELLVQQTPQPTAYLVGSVSGGHLTIAQITGTPDATDTWKGQTSGAVFKPTAAPAASTTPAPICLNGGTTAAPQGATSTGNDGTQLIPDASGGNFETALNGNGSTIPAASPVLGNVPIFNLLSVPGENNAAAIGALHEFCARFRAFLIVDAAQTATVTGLSNGPVDGESTPATLVTHYASNSAFYFPWVTAPDPMSGYLPAQFRPCGFVAGIYASTDARRGVWKAPAGIEARRFELGPGDSLLAPRKIPHAWAFVGDRGRLLIFICSSEQDGGVVPPCAANTRSTHLRRSKRQAAG